MPVFLSPLLETTFKKSLYYCIFIMNDTNNQFIDDDGLSKFTSLTHLLNDDNSTDTGDIELMNHSPYFSETDFQRLQFKNGRLSIMSLNCQSINAKFDELQLFINRISKVEEIGVVCSGVVANI